MSKSSHSGIQNITLNPIPPPSSADPSLHLSFPDSNLCALASDFQGLSLVPDKFGEGEGWPRDVFELAFQMPASGQMAYLDPVPH